MTSVTHEQVGPEHGLLGHLTPILIQILSAALIVAVMLLAAMCFCLRPHQYRSIPDTESSIEDKKTWFESPTLLPELVASYSHPLALTLFHKTGIPTSGDLIQLEHLNSSTLAPCAFPLSVPTSGDLAAMAPPSTAEERRHPWRRHSYPDPKSSEGDLSQYQRDAVITGDSVDFFRDDKSGKLWRRRTMEFGSVG